jgi:acetyl esterase/lipase
LQSIAHCDEARNVAVRPVRGDVAAVAAVNNSLVYYAALKKAGVPAELHLYPTGGHGFGLRRTKNPITAWPQRLAQSS